MAEKRRKKVPEKDLTGLKYSDRLLPLFERLHEVGCERDTATNLLDLLAWVIALIYRYRWTIEVFFRFFKHVLGCRHLLSTKAEGIEIQTYMAIIACMLISLCAGRKPTLRTYEMICYYFIGWATKDELPAHIAKLQQHDAT